MPQFWCGVHEERLLCTTFFLFCFVLQHPHCDAMQHKMWINWSKWQLLLRLNKGELSCWLYFCIFISSLFKVKFTLEISSNFQLLGPSAAEPTPSWFVQSDFIFIGGGSPNRQSLYGTLTQEEPLAVNLVSLLQGVRRGHLSRARRALPIHPAKLAAL